MAPAFEKTIKLMNLEQMFYRVPIEVASISSENFTAAIPFFFLAF
jgi:hypothetical protein